MLILTRRIGEIIHIGSDITITVMNIEGRIVRVGINAPKEIKILRAELLPVPKPETIPETKT